VAAAVEPVRFNNGEIWNAWVDYNGSTSLLEVRWSMSTTRPGASQLSHTVNLTAVLGQNTAFLGFTSATGSGWGNHDILSWQYRDSFNPIDPMAVPEPATWISGLMAVVVTAGVQSRRRRRAG
jgi:hypothetical protein